jgi:Uma2 family endonuclease
MSNPTETEQAQFPPDESEDPFRYGWRLKYRWLPDGRYQYWYVALTPEDVLFPEEEDFIVHNDLHQILVDYLYDVLRSLYVNIESTVVLNDVRMAWDVPGLKPLGPDVMVIFDVKERKNWGTFYQAQEGTAPTVVFEVTSPETRYQDVGPKILMYEQARVPYYIIVDTGTRLTNFALRVTGYQLIGDSYREIEPETDGRLMIEPLNVLIGVEGRDNLRALWLYTPDGQRFEHQLEATTALVAAQAQLKQSAMLIAATEDRVEAAEAWANIEATARQQAEAAAAAEATARQQAEAARQQAEAAAAAEATARQQAEAARQQAEAAAAAEATARQQAEATAAAEATARQQAEAAAAAEATARQQAEARIRELEAEMRRLRGES